jgi:squalene synthase HpnC
LNNEFSHLNDITHLYNQAIDFTKSHYENFPVISFFVPKDLRKYVAVVYQFARQADDIADEGNFTNEERLSKLNAYHDELIKSTKGEFLNSFWFLLNDTITSKNLSIKNFENLLIAFKQDLVKKKYENFEELLGYCKNSANPVGRIILELYNIKDEEAKIFSDKICTALQLTNFYQDVKIDYQKGRIYIPQEDMQKFSVTENEIKNKIHNQNFIDLMKFEIYRTKNLFIEGRKLLSFLPFKLKVEISATIKGGEAILTKIEKLNFDVTNQNPKLNKKDFLKIFFVTLFLRK